MARKKTTTVRANVKAQVSARLRAVRLEIFGEHGGPELARRLNLPARTWYNYETGVTVPAEVLLGFIQQTRVDPGWLLTGLGPKYRDRADQRAIEELTPQQLIRRGLEILERQPHGEVEGNQGASGFLALDVVPISQLCAQPGTPMKRLGRVLADRRWIPHPDETIAIRLDDDSMSPILAAGSMVAIDRAVREPIHLHGRLVGACVEGQPMVRWLEVSGKHLILRPNLPSRDHSSIPIGLDRPILEEITGLVVWSWSSFDEP